MITDETTAKRFWTLVEQENMIAAVPAIYQFFYVLSRTDELWNSIDKIYDINSHMLVDGWDTLFEGTLKKMLKRSVHLYNPFQSFDVSTFSLFEDIDERNAETMINALKIYQGFFDFETIEK